jgi:hypothetical protein
MMELLVFGVLVELNAVFLMSRFPIVPSFGTVFAMTLGGALFAVFELAMLVFVVATLVTVYNMGARVWEVVTVVGILLRVLAVGGFMVELNRRLVMRWTRA